MSDAYSDNQDDIAELLSMQAQLRASSGTSPTSKIGGYANNLIEGAKIVGGAVGDMWTGNKQRTGNFPEMNIGEVENLKEGLGQVLGNASANDPLGYANIMKNWLPGSKVTFDQNNNPLIKWNGKTYYANAPGVSGNDWQRLATDMLAYYPAARWASTGQSLLTKGLKGGALSAAANWLQQAGAQQMGSEQELNLPMMGVAGMSGVASEVLAPFLSNTAYALWSRLGRGRIVNGQGAPTSFGRTFAEQVGLDPDAISAAMWQTLDRHYARLDRATKEAFQNARQVAQSIPAQAAQEAHGAVAAANQSAGGIPMTTGQMTRNQEGLDFEEMARTGRMGTGARETMGAFDRGQSQAVLGRMDQLQGMAGGGRVTSSTPEALGQALQEGVNKAEQRMWNAVTNSYEAVPSGVRLSADPLLSLGDGISTALRNEAIFPDRAGFDILAPRTNKILNDVRRVMGEKAALPPSKRNFGLMELEQERKASNQAMRGAEGTDLTALTILKRTFDQRVERVWDDALLKGDPASLEMLKAARRARTEYGQMFEPQNVEQTVARTLQKMITQPDIDNNQVVNWMFGTAETGFGNAGLQMVRQMRRIFPKQGNVDPPEWHALREAAMMKMLYGQSSNAMRDATWNADKVISKSSQQLLRRMDNFLDLQGSQVMKELFTKQELDQIRRFRYELRQIQPGENQATLRTGASMGLWFMKVGNFIENAIKLKMGVPPAATPSATQAVSSVAQGWTNNAKAQAAVGGWTPPEVRSWPVFRSFLTGAVAGAGGPTPQRPAPPEQQ